MAIALPIKTALRSRLTARGGIWIVFAVFLTLGLANTTEVWTKGHHGWNGARRSIEAISYLNFGYLKTKLVPLDNEETLVGPSELPERTKGYKHHPPLTMIYLSWIYWLFGEGEAQARLGFLLVSCLTFWFLYGAFRRVVSERFALIAMTFYTFMPIQATNLNLVNFELLVLLAMACLVYGYERLRERFAYRYCVLMAAGIFIGTFSDYPALTFSGIFYLYAAWHTWMMRNDKVDGRVVWVIIGYPVWQLICALGLVWLFSIWSESAESLVSLYKGRGMSAWTKLESLVFDHWKGFVDFFSPVVYLFVVVYFLDLVYRLKKHRLRRLDGLILVYFVNSATLLIALQKWFRHNYASLYFVPMFALASAFGFERILQLLRERPKTVWLVGGLGFVLTFVYTLPIIHNRRISPSNEYVEPVYFRHSKVALDFDEYMDLLASAAHRIVYPGELSVHQGLKRSFQARYYLRRISKGYENPIEIRKRSKRDVAYLVRLTKASDGLLKPWLTQASHLRVDEFALFDWKGDRLAHTEVLTKKRQPRSDIRRYFSSMVRTGTTLVRDDWRSLDYNLKLGRDRDVAYYRNLVRTGAPVHDSLYAAIALYNNRLAYGGTDALSSITSKLRKVKGGRTLAPGVELVGYRLKRDNGGRHIATVVVRPKSPLVGNFSLRWCTNFASSSESSWYRKRMRRAKGKVPFDTPTYEWKAGWLYYAQFDLSVPYERYRLEISLARIGNASFADPDTSEVWFGLRCRRVGRGTIREHIKRPKLNQFPITQNDFRLGKQLRIERCVIGQEERRKKWRVLLQLSHTDRPLSNYHFSLMARNAKRRYIEADVKFYRDIEKWQRGESQTVAFLFPDKINKRPRRLWINVAQSANKNIKPIDLTTEAMGRRFTFHWLVKADVYRFRFRDLLF